MAQVVGFVEAPGLGLDLPLDVQGTAFQRRVWQALQEIPAGSTVSYAEIAGRIAQGGQGSGPGVRGQRTGGGNSLPPCGSQRRWVVGLSLGGGTQARAAAAGGAHMSTGV